MAMKKPLALYSGKIDELHSGDAVIASDEGFTGLNNTGSPITKGQLVYKTGTTTEIALANATDDTKNAIGLADEAIADSGSGFVRTDQIISLADWTDITGSASLTPGSNNPYFLDTTAGKMTLTPPSGAGKIVQEVGYAVSATDFMVKVKSRILLS